MSNREIEFTPGPGGLMVAEIQNSHGHAMVALNGGHVLSFQPRGDRLVLWASAHSHYATGKPIRGGIPVCWPWFGPHSSDTAKPAHGFARTSEWQVLGHDAGAGDTRLRLGLADSDASRALWPHAFELELIITVGLALDVELVIRNTGATAFTCTGALHSYFAVSHISSVVIHGLEGCAYLDKVQNHARFEQAGAIDITAETDRVYLNTTADCLIADAGWDRAIRVAKRGSQTTVVWNPWSGRARQISDFGDEEFREMVCVETANAADDQIVVPAGGQHRIATTISVVTLSSTSTLRA